MMGTLRPGEGRPPAKCALRVGRSLAMMLVLVVWLAGCGEADKRPLGGTCTESEQCLSGTCLNGQCVDPLADDDSDGLTNGFEYSIGSETGLQDSDSDGILDPAELGPDLALIDTDGDGLPDIIESTSEDQDGDCIPDQFDARNAVADTDLSPMIDVVCPKVGVCSDQVDKLRAHCPQGVAACLFTDVVGYASPEAACDGRDDNCDGQIDEAFPGGCAQKPFVAPAGGKTVSTSRYRATLVMGQPALIQTSTERHRAILGGNPILTPQTRPEANP